MRIKTEVNLSPVQTPVTGSGYTPEEALSEAKRCLDCPAAYCRRDCPIHTPVPEMCRKIREGDLEGAYEIVAENNLMTPMTCRVCPAEKQCQKSCTRSIRGEAVNIPGIEQFLNDWHDSKHTYTQQNLKGSKVAVVGAGPAGLSCAAELLKSGCSVTVYDAANEPGGVPKWGIPGFILPSSVTETVLCELKDLGAEFIGGMKLGEDISLAELQNQYEAVFLSLGAPVPVSGGFDNAMQAQSLLLQASLGRDPIGGRTVAIFGGGDTAIDAARVAKRLGSSQVTLVYRRGREEMPARKQDVATALDEGIEFHWWTEPVLIEEGKILCRRTMPAAPDYPGGRANAVSIPESEFEIAADVAVLALGFQNTPVPGVACDRRGRVLVDENGHTNVHGVFAGGDVVSGPSTVVKAAAAGKRAAWALLDYLNNK